jgi:ElaB/YqjD/DUF883 family membrane-anchored ribosome-binding protein
MITEADKTSAELEYDVERTRARMTGTLDELRARMSPGQIIDEIFHVARDSGGGEMVRNLGRAVRDNPAPLLLMGAGVIWMMAGSGTSRRERPAAAGTPAHRNLDMAERSFGPASSGGAEVSSDYDETAPGNTAPSLAEEAASASSQAAGMAERAVAGVREGASSVSDVVSDASASLKEKMGAATEGATRAMHDTRDVVNRSARHVTSAFTNLLHEQPLMLGVLGLTLGATLGALIPETDTENRLMGKTRDALKDQVGNIASEQYEKVKAVAEKTLETVKESAAEQGLTGDDMKSGISGLAAKGKAVFDAAKETAAAEAETQGLTPEELEKQASQTGSGERTGATDSQGS